MTNGTLKRVTQFERELELHAGQINSIVRGVANGVVLRKLDALAAIAVQSCGEVLLGSTKFDRRCCAVDTFMPCWFRRVSKSQ